MSSLRKLGSTLLFLFLPLMKLWSSLLLFATEKRLLLISVLETDFVATLGANFGSGHCLSISLCISFEYEFGDILISAAGEFGKLTSVLDEEICDATPFSLREGFGDVQALQLTEMLSFNSVQVEQVQDLEISVREAVLRIDDPPFLI